MIAGRRMHNIIFSYFQIEGLDGPFSSRSNGLPRQHVAGFSRNGWRVFYEFSLIRLEYICTRIAQEQVKFLGGISPKEPNSLLGDSSTDTVATKFMVHQYSILCRT